MSITKLRMRGEPITAPAVVETSEYYQFESSFSISSTMRDDTPEQQVDLREDHIIELVFEDDTVWLGNRDTLDELFPDAQPAMRGDSETWTLPSEVQTDELDRSLIKKAGLKLLSLFVKKKGVAPAIAKLAKKLEDKQLGEVRGLCFCDENFKLKTFDDAAQGGQYLLFLHGTASNTESSFDKLKSFRHWKNMLLLYPSDHVLAFQHETLTKSPLENVLQLVEQLPAEASLDLISHSRGGLVADLLCRFCSNPQGFGSHEILYLEKVKRIDDLKMISDIEQAIQNKNIKVRKLIRVACPAQGTTLASKRLNTFFNITFNLVGVAAGASFNPVYVAFKDLIIAAIETKDDPEILPGVEAMNPASPFIKVLNFAATNFPVESLLLVIAGNSKVSLQWRGLLVLASKLFYTAPNDLVVNTRSMYDGAQRQPGKGYYFLDQSSATNHFAYFDNEISQQAIYNALKFSGEGRLAGFEPLEQNLRTELDRNAALGLDGGKVFRDEVSGQKPIVVLLPGIMGSNLMVKSDIVWINYFRFLTGALTSLEYTTGNNKNIRAHSLIRTSYKKLADYLESHYDVVTFPFDWRLPLADITQTLDDKLKALMTFNQPIKLLGHSMGGVLLRDFMLYQPDTWEKLNATAGFRVLLLGAPLGGSFRIPYVLFGQDDIIGKLAKIDIRNTKKDLLKVFCNLPGLHSLLPLQTDENHDFADPALWEQMRKAAGDLKWPIPDKEHLQKFATYREKVIAGQPGINFSNVVYVAGQGRQGKDTPCGYEINEGKLSFLSTLEGDESVTWSSGIPQALKENGKVYYSGTTHGELANDPMLFAAITDILERGETSRLRSSAPAVRSTDKIFVTRQIEDFDLSEEGVERTLLGLNAPQEFTPTEAPVQIMITNGDLRYARYPVLAGHFAHDGILSSEKAIDNQLNGELTRRLQLGLHPGMIRENEVILTDRPPDEGFQGTVLVGLGNPGELTPYQLQNTVEQGVSKYLSIINVKNSFSNWASQREKIGISVLAVAGSYGGLTLQSSLRSVLTGIQNANENLRREYGPLSKRIEMVEVIELYLDRALGAVYAVKEFERDENRSLNMVLQGNTMNQKPGRRERMPVDNTTDWWTRINVRSEESPAIEGMEPRRSLLISISTNGAREEERRLMTDSTTLLEMVDEMSRKNRWSETLAKTMFELLIPNDFKDQVKRQSNINWILDKYTAAFPWELLQSSSGKALPLCVHAGMIRQLATRDFRLRIQAVGERTALVVADPNLEKFFGQLPGALAEGKKVNEMLTAQNYQTKECFGTKASDIYLALFSLNYRIVHLAGHGIYNAKNPAASGMLIGKNAFLTTAELSQMSTTPELVFVNCCYLGEVDSRSDTLMQERYKLAANIGVQLIENGVKAVVVAGWAVEDSAALDFSSHFYNAMFAGNSFGEAVKKARKKIFEDHGHRNNTWGAYQCYGDPFYRLEREEYREQEQYDFVISEEAEIQLANIAYGLNTGSNEQPERVIQAVRKISTAIDRANLRNPKITEREASIYAAVQHYKEAIEKYESLKEFNKAAFTFSAMEQYCNIRAKYAHQQMDKEGLPWATAMMESVIKDLNALMQFGETPERLSLAGSCWKRMIFLTPVKNKKDKINAIETAAEFYKKAWEKSKNTDPYPLNNWLQLEAILVFESAGRKQKRILPKDAQSWLEKEIRIADDFQTGKIFFWQMATRPNLMLTQWLTGLNKVTRKQVQPAYGELWKNAGHAGNKSAEIEHITLIENALGVCSNPEGKQMADDIGDFKNFLLGLKTSR